VREYLLILVFGAAVTYVSLAPIRIFARRFGFMTPVRDRDVHTTEIPRLGGVGMLIGLLAALLLARGLTLLGTAFDTNSAEVLGALLAGALLVGVGVLDDRYDLDAITKFAGQTTAAGVLIIFGVQWSTFWMPFGGGTVLSLGYGQGMLLTVLFTVVLVNAMNFVDGLDGLAAGIGMIGALAVGTFAISLILQYGNDPSYYSPALIAAVLGGACVGFLPHNFNPARIFMGDSGSMLIGVLLAAATTSASGKIPVVVDSPRYYLASLAPLIVFAAVLFVPVLDLAMAVVRRTRAGMSPFSPDKMHLHHRLLEIGHSQRRAVLLIYLWAGVLAFGAVALTFITDAVVVLWTVGFGLLLAALASAVPRMRHRV